MTKIATATRLLKTPDRFLDVVLYRIYGLSVVSQSAFRYIDRRDRRHARQHKIEPVPPAKIRFLTIGTVNPRVYWQTGERDVEFLEDALSTVGKSFGDFDDILDFGCGVGRMLRILSKRYPDARLSGTDVHGSAVQWCRKNAQWARFESNGFLPPSRYDDAAYDLIYLNSVFTHIDIDAQNAWLGEFQRVLKPGGYLVVTVCGPDFWQSMPDALLQGVRENGADFLQPSVGRPDGALHTPEYVQREWSKYFEVLTYVPAGTSKVQDIVVMRKAF